MKNKLEYYYNLNISEIITKKNCFVLKSEEEIFILKEMQFADDNLMDFILLNRRNGNEYLLPIENIKNEFLIEMDEKKYMLLKVNRDNKNLYDNFDYCKLQVANTKYTYKIWEEKVDYCRTQLINFFVGHENKHVINLFNYYSGLAENAIMLMEKYEDEFFNEKRYLSRIRIFYPNNTINYYDPTKYVIDYRARDYAEWIKSRFFKDKDVDINEINFYMSKFGYDDNDKVVFFARLLYPTYFFDAYEDFILGLTTEFELNQTLLNMFDYEKFLYKIWKILSKSCFKIPKIDWLVKN